MPSTPITFIPAEMADANDLVALRIAAMRDSLERIGRFDLVRARQRFMSTFAPEVTRHIIVAGVRVGFFVVRPDQGELALDHLYVDPTWQGRGIGAAALRQVFAEADAQQLPVRVGALRESGSNRFYARHGFVQVDQGEWDIYYVRPCQKAR